MFADPSLLEPEGVETFEFLLIQGLPLAYTPLRRVRGHEERTRFITNRYDFGFWSDYTKLVDRINAMLTWGCHFVGCGSSKTGGAPPKARKALG